VQECAGLSWSLTGLGSVAKPMYRVSEAVRAAHGNDGSVVLDIRKGRVLRLNVTAALIFQSLQQGATVAQIIDRVSRRFSIPHEVAGTDVGDFLKSMVQEGLVQAVPPVEFQ
jgi:coenzyme PQQ synthesis protein D (PqqD)